MSDREMTMADASKQAPRCPTCGQTKMQVDSAWQCLNCGPQEPKTGRTMIVNEDANGKVKLEFIAAGEGKVTHASPSHAAPAALNGTISVNVPLDLFPDLVIWARKLKLPKSWEQAAKIKAITDFQVELTNKLGGLI
jgi:ribosomal protein L37AE/L43A